MAKPERTKVKKNEGRKLGWVGTRVTVCGRPIRQEGMATDFICLLPPGHFPTYTHVTVAMDESNLNNVYTLTLNDETGEIQWRE